MKELCFLADGVRDSGSPQSEPASDDMGRYEF